MPIGSSSSTGHKYSKRISDLPEFSNGEEPTPQGWRIQVGGSCLSMQITFAQKKKECGWCLENTDDNKADVIKNACSIIK